MKNCSSKFTVVLISLIGVVVSANAAHAAEQGDQGNNSLQNRLLDEINTLQGTDSVGSFLTATRSR